jgi:hypothetical protein
MDLRILYAGRFYTGIATIDIFYLSSLPLHIWFIIRIYIAVLVQI